MFKQFGRPGMSNIIQEVLEDAAYDEKYEDFDEDQLEQEVAPDVAPEINAEPENLEGKINYSCKLYIDSNLDFKKYF